MWNLILTYFRSSPCILLVASTVSHEIARHSQATVIQNVKWPDQSFSGILVKLSGWWWEVNWHEGGAVGSEDRWVDGGSSLGHLCGPPKPTSDPDLQANGSCSRLISNDMKKPHDIFHLVLFNWYKGYLLYLPSYKLTLELSLSENLLLLLFIIN